MKSFRVLKYFLRNKSTHQKVSRETFFRVYLMHKLVPKKFEKPLEAEQKAGGLMREKKELSPEDREKLELERKRSLNAYKKTFENASKLTENQRTFIRDYMLARPQECWGVIPEITDEDVFCSGIRRLPNGNIQICVWTYGAETTSII